jgi:hypothetical protein
VVIKLTGRILTASMDSGREEQLSLDLAVDLSTFLSSAEVVVGASHGGSVGSREQYGLGDTGLEGPASEAGLDIHTAGSYSDHFRGCIGEVRIDGVLVPFFNEAELVNTLPEPGSGSVSRIKSKLCVTPSYVKYKLVKPKLS